MTGADVPPVGHDAPTDDPSVPEGPALREGPALLVGSSGGHLAQLLPLGRLWPQEDVVWVTFPTPDALSQLQGRRLVSAYHPTTRNIGNLVRNAWLAWRVVREVRPIVVVSTGAGVALPFFVVARLLGIPTVFIEVYDRVDSATLTGRLSRPFVTRYLVQWEEQRALYPRADVVGALL